MNRSTAIIHLEDHDKSKKAAAWLSEAGFKTRSVDGHRAIGSACEGEPPSVLVLEGPLSASAGVEAVKWLRRGGVTCPVVFVCDSAFEASTLRETKGIAPFAACSGFSEETIKLVVGSREAGPNAAAVASRGKLSEHDLSELIIRAHTTAFTGTLELSSSGTEKTIYFDRGAPVYCSSSILSENFGQMLLRKGVITEIDYNWARKLQQREGIRQGEALVKIGVLNHETLFESLREQIKEKIVNAFGARTGTYSFKADAGALHNVTRFDLNPFDLMVEGRSRFMVNEDVEEQWARCETRWVVRNVSPSVFSAQIDAWLGEAGTTLSGPTHSKAFAAEQGWDATGALAFFETMAALEETITAATAEALPVYVVTCDAAPDNAQAHFGDEDEDYDAYSAENQALSEELWRAYLRLTSADHFEALGIDHDATEAEVIKARNAKLEVYSAGKYQPLMKATRLMHALREIRTKLKVAARILTDDDHRADYIETVGHDPRNERDRFLSAEDAFVAGMSMLESEPRSACRYFTRAAQLNPNEATYKMYRGWALYQYAETKEQANEARRQVAQAVGNNPLLDDGYAFLGQMYLNSGDNEEALAQARTSLAFNPDNARAIALMGIIPCSGPPATAVWS